MVHNIMTLYNTVYNGRVDYYCSLGKIHCLNIVSGNVRDTTKIKIFN